MAERRDKPETEGTEELVKTAEQQGLPRPVAEDVVEEVIAQDVAPEKLKEVVEETAKVEQEDRMRASGKAD